MTTKDTGAPDDGNKTTKTAADASPGPTCSYIAAVATREDCLKKKIDQK